MKTETGMEVEILNGKESVNTREFLWDLGIIYPTNQMKFKIVLVGRAVALTSQNTHRGYHHNTNTIS